MFRADISHQKHNNKSSQILLSSFNEKHMKMCAEQILQLNLCDLMDEYFVKASNGMSVHNISTLAKSSSKRRNFLSKTDRMQLYPI